MTDEFPAFRFPLDPVSTRAKTALVADDNSLCLKLMEALLNAKGYSTLRAADGKQAIDIAINHKPDIIILDILMPHMSGIEAIVAIRGKNELKNIPVIAVTACGLEGDRDRIISSGFDFYLLKPFTISLFMNTIENALGN